MPGKRRRREGSQHEPYLVFISHATFDKFLATVLCEKIEQTGAATFRDDRDIAGGDSIPDTIKKTIQRCDELIVLLTPQSITRDWVRFEIGMAFALDCRIVPIFYHVAPESTPAIIKDNRGFHLNELRPLRRRPPEASRQAMSVATDAIYDVFVCHGAHDVGIAGIVRRAFEAEQLEVFAVHEIKPVEAFLSELRQALAECHAVVLILTRSTLQSPDVALEIGMATAWNKPVYVLYDGIAKAEIPVYLRELHVAPISQLDHVVREIRENQQPLTPEQLQRLVKTYEELAIPTDQLLTKPLLLRDLAKKYNRSSRTTVPAQRLIQELIRLRKQGRLPKVRG